MIPAFVAIVLLAAAPSASAAIPPTADLATTLTSSGIATVGGYMGYTLTVTNNGPDTASNVVITDSMPSSRWSRYPTTFYCVGSPGSATGWCGPLPPNVSCTAPKVGSPGTVSCKNRALRPGASMTVIIAIRVGFYFHNQVISDTATATSATFDPNTANNTATASARVN